jgi:hypothetical protein
MIRNTITYKFLLPLAALAVFGTAAIAQSSSPTPEPQGPEVTLGDYKVTAATEIGFRWRSVDGTVDKYRSDLDYKQGVRTFDSSIFFETEKGKGKAFDSLLITNTGWGSDPYALTRVSMERTGWYKFDANVRRNRYYNFLANHALGQRFHNTKQTFGDFDVTIFPQNDRLRLNFGASFSGNSGVGSTHARGLSDEFPIATEVKNRSNDYRAGIEGKLLGFNVGLTQGIRLFRDNTTAFSGPQPGNNTTNNGVLTEFRRFYPIDGITHFTRLHVQRTFGDVFDFTGRLIYGTSRTDFEMTEIIRGRDNSNNFVDLDLYTISGRAKRPQTRGDLAGTYYVTDRFEISNSFAFDGYNVTGGERFEELLQRRNAAGSPLAQSIVGSTGYRLSRYQRYSNTLAGDYRFSNKVNISLGWRHTRRSVNFSGIDRTLTSPPSATNPLIIAGEEHENTTNSLIASMKVKPTKFWTVNWNLEKGQADNFFTRTDNYTYDYFRIHSRLNLDKFSFNASFANRNNENPSRPTDLQPTAVSTDVSNRSFSAEVDWRPDPRFSVSTGWTYRHMTTLTPIVVPVAGVFRLGSSQYFIRDHYAFVDVNAKVARRLSLYASYRFNRDKGQGDRTANQLEQIVGSYPMSFKTPEARVAIKLTRNIDWNIGYQYYGYRDTLTPLQNYRAHLPTTSLRFYWGRDADAR